MNKAIFLDRDGVINHEGHSPVTIKNLKIIPEAIDALKKIPKDFKKIVITNQGWITGGLLKEEEVHEVHNTILKEFASQSVHIDAFYFCPHRNEINCDCKKPKPGMLLQAKKDHDINIEESYMIGDMMRDIEAGKAAGCKKSILIERNYSYELSPNTKIKPDHKVNNIHEAINIIFPE